MDGLRDPMDYVRVITYLPDTKTFLTKPDGSMFFYPEEADQALDELESALGDSVNAVFFYEDVEVVE